MRALRHLFETVVIAAAVGSCMGLLNPVLAQGTSPPAGGSAILIMTDDTGFGAASTFGGPIATPTLDRVANSGLRYNQFHTTALCSPTRAALLTGRNHQSVGMGNVTECATG